MMVATTCFWVFTIRPSNSASTLMVTTSYDKAVPARTAFFVYTRCRSICDTYTNNEFAIPRELRKGLIDYINEYNKARPHKVLSYGMPDSYYIWPESDKKKKSSKSNVLRDWVLEKFIFVWYNNAILMHTRARRK